MVADPGAAAERTSLAWSRSALSLATVGALAAKRAADPPRHALDYVVAGAFFALAIVAEACGRARFVRNRHPAGLRLRVSHPRAIRTVGLVTTLAAGACAALVATQT